MIDRVFGLLGTLALIVAIVYLLVPDNEDKAVEENFYVCGSNYEDNHLVKLPTGYNKVITIVYDIDTVICSKVEGFLEWSDVNEPNATN